MDLSKWSARAAAALVLLLVTGIALNFTILDTTGIVDPLERARYLVSHRAWFSSFIFALYALFGCLIPLVGLGLHERLEPKAPEFGKLSVVFSLLWSVLLLGSGLVYLRGLQEVVRLLPTDPSAAVQTLRIVEIVHEGLGCTLEIPGALWMIFVGAAIRQSAIFPPACGTMSMVVGSCGLLTVVPGVSFVAAVAFGLLSILWFGRMGYLLSRNPRPSNHS